MPPTLLITGGSGYLGRHLAAAARASFTVHTTCYANPRRITATAGHSLNLTDRRAVLKLITQLAPQAIIHTAALNAGADLARLMDINGNGSQYVAEGAAMVGARLVHLSTDALHNGRQAPYADDAPPDPITPYGHSKAAAEAAVISAHPAAAIVRTSLIYSLQEIDRGTAEFARRLAAGRPVILFTDQIRQPVWMDTLIQALLKLVTSHAQFAGHLNIAGNQPLSREAFARRLLDWWQIEHRRRVTPGLAATLPNPVPLDVRLSLDKGQSVLSMPFPGVDEAMTICKSPSELIK